MPLTSAVKTFKEATRQQVEEFVRNLAEWARFAQDDRVRVRLPRRNQQVKLTRSPSNNRQFVAYINAIGKLDGTRCLLEWKTTSSRYPEEPHGPLALDPQLVC